MYQFCEIVCLLGYFYSLQNHLKTQTDGTYAILKILSPDTA